jgi:ketosteroid isomerase-like protein
MAPEGESFARRLRRLEDADQIRQLNLAYRRHLDARDLDSYGALFAADGEWLGGTGYGKGPAGIAAMLRERLAGNPGPPGATSWHVVTESDISVHGDRATGTVSWALIQRGEGDTPVMRLLGHYDDQYVRENGRWRYQRRAAHTDIPYRELDLPAGWSAPPGLDVPASPAPEGDLALRLRRLEDREQIRRLTQLYRRYLDALDLVAYGRLFAADGEWLGGTGYGKSPAGITAMLAERLPARGPDGPSAWHLVTEPEVELAGDRAAGVATWSWVGRGDGIPPALRLLGHYQDSYVREDGQWRFQRRIAHTGIPHRPLDVPAEWAAPPTGTASGGTASGGTASGGGEPAGPAGDAEARLRRLEDLARIRQLFVDYKMVLDKQDFAAYAALFAADGEFIAGSQVAKGRAAIQALVEGMPGSLLGSGPGEDFHVVVNPLIDLDPADPDRATAGVTWLYVVKGDDGGPALAKLGHYEDELVREDGRWRFARRAAPTDIG